MRTFRLLLLVVVVIFFVGAKKTTDKLYVLESAPVMTKPAGSRLGFLDRGAELRFLEEKEGWVKVQVVGWIPKISVTADTLEVLTACEVPIGVEMLSKTFIKAAAPESTDKVVIRVRFENQGRPGGAFGARMEKQVSPDSRVISNIPGSTLTEFTGVIKLKDGLGYHVSRAEVSFDKRLAFGDTLEWDWVIPCAGDDDKKSALRVVKLGNFAATFFAKRVNYADGSELFLRREEYILRAE